MNLEELQNSLKGDLFSDPITKSIYSVDASIYEILPDFIIQPKNESDIEKTIQFAKEKNLSIIGRGAATGTAGGCLGKGIIVDVSRYMKKILEIDWEKKTVWVEAGATIDSVNNRLEEKGYRLGPEISTSDRATVGGLVATNGAGGQSLKYGSCVDHVLEIEMVLASGETKIFGQEEKDDFFTKTAKKIKKEYGEEITKKFPKTERRSSGYLLDRLIKNPNFICPAIVGSEGTLGIITKIKFKIVEKIKNSSFCLIISKKMEELFFLIKEILKTEPLTFEMIDEKIVEAGKKSSLVKGKIDFLPEEKRTLFFVEYEEEGNKKAEQLALHLKEKGFSTKVLEGKEKKLIKLIRKEGLGLLLSKRSFTRAVGFIEDIAVPPENLKDFFPEFLEIIKNNHLEVGIYGHVGPGCLHVRPYLDLSQEKDKEKMKKVMEETAGLIQKYQGVMSGEHGDGRTRSYLIEKIFGKKIREAFQEWKKAFDPDNLMNPGKIVYAEDPFDHFRKKPQVEVSTFLDFSKEGGFSLSLDLCNGNGRCRKKEGVMCPSYQVTNDEYDTTRARAQVFRSILNGNLSEKISGEGLKEILDLCIGCKGCKKECPSQVDMAKMKQEALYQHSLENKRPVRDYLFGYFSEITHAFSYFPWIFNKIGETKWGEKIGLSSQKKFPKITNKRFSDRRKSQKKPSVFLFSDTFTEFYHPEIGEKAVDLLTFLKEEVGIISWQCCGRPFLSKGFLKQAKEKAKKMVEKILLLNEENIPIIFLEPSCLYTIKDDYLSLFKNEKEMQEKVKKIEKNMISLDLFLEDKNLFSKKEKKEILFHGHCYEKACVGTKPTKTVLEKIAKVKEIPSGCCGMAGSFGYEKEHEGISNQIGELILFPSIQKEMEKEVIANGFSCRSHIEQNLRKKALHLAEYLIENL